MFTRTHLSNLQAHETLSCFPDNRVIGSRSCVFPAYLVNALTKDHLLLHSAVGIIKKKIIFEDVCLFILIFKHTYSR